MCVAQFYGALTNDKPTLDSVCLTGDSISDPWNIPGVPRLLAKLLVAVLYGSSATSRALVKSALSTKEWEQLDPTIINKMNDLRKSGRFAVMEALKNALIKNSKVETPVTRVKLWNQEFDIHINKFINKGSIPIVTQAWDSSKQKFKTSITRQPVKIPDYGRMTLFWATCLIHGIESQVFDQIAFETDAWLLTNHDAILTMPWTTKQAREKYAHKVKLVNKDRYKIIQDFRQSIGATCYQSDVDFYKVAKLTTDAGDVQFNAIAMK